MSMNYNELKLCLVDYLIRVEKYKPSKLSSEKISYLVNKKQPHQIVVVSIGEPSESDKNLTTIKTEIKVGARERLEVLTIVISDEKIQGFVCVKDLDEAKFKLYEFFPKVKNLKVETESQEYSDEEILEQLQDPKSSSNQKLKELITKMNGRSFVSLILSAVFFVIPILTLVFYLVIFYTKQANITDAVASLFFGGSTRALTIEGQQFWRVFTYGFNVLSDGLILGILEVILVTAFGIKIARYTEGVIGSWKFAVIVIVTYPLAGLFATVMLPNAQFSGVFVFFTSVTTILGVTTWNKKTDAVALYSKSRVIMATIILVLLLLFIKPTSEYVIVIAAAGISGSLALMFTYDYSKVDFYLAFPIIILLGLILTPFAAILIPTPALAFDANVAQALGWSAAKKIISVDGANKILNQHLGWRWYIAAENGVYYLKPFL